MTKVEYYEENFYTKEYYLAQYVLSRVFLRKKYCYLLLTQTEYTSLKESLPDITINNLYEVPELQSIVYEIYKN